MKRKLFEVVIQLQALDAGNAGAIVQEALHSTGASFDSKDGKPGAEIVLVKKLEA